MILKKVVSLSCSRYLYTGSRESVDNIRVFTRQFEGGSVDLVKKDSGVAHIVLNNPDRRNAVSGSMMADMLDVVQVIIVENENTVNSNQ